MTRHSCRASPPYRFLNVELRNHWAISLSASPMFAESAYAQSPRRVRFLADRIVGATHKVRCARSLRKPLSHVQITGRTKITSVDTSKIICDACRLRPGVERVVLGH